MQFDEDQYEAALNALAEQLVAMADEDSESREELIDTVDNYTGDAVEQLQEKIRELVG